MGEFLSNIEWEKWALRGLGVAILSVIGLSSLELVYRALRKQRLGLKFTDSEQSLLDLVSAVNKENREKQIKLLDDQITKYEAEKKGLLEQG